MPIGSRLREERERLGLSQTDFGAAAGVGRKTQFNYESEERSPDGDYFAAIAALGIDVRYVITGSRDYDPPQSLTAEEQVMLKYFRDSPALLRQAALGALGSGTAAGRSSLVFQAGVGSVVQGDLSVSGGMNVDQRSAKRAPRSKPDIGYKK